ncbi:MAG: hypothetical protein KA314_21990 [Chloroflexi bacterium]|nr:hypothetical protein [Chloroflexota bacterium]MBP8058513.1 hypothetical protein [Chloroflexota bacterium]
MNPILFNLRLQELVAIVQENRRFFDDFVQFLTEEGYSSIQSFVQEPSDTRAIDTITHFLKRRSEVKLYDGLLRPYANAKAKWYFLAWLLRDAATQRLQPLLTSVPGETSDEQKAYLLNEIRKFVDPLFPAKESWEWAAIAEIMLARLEGSRRALKGTLFEEVVKRGLQIVIDENRLPLQITPNQVHLHEETYDIQLVGHRGTILFPVKTRETMGGGHALLFTRDIYKSILVATEKGYMCVPIVIAESWGGNLETLNAELFIYIQANPNQIATIEPLLLIELQKLLPLLQTIV